MSLYYEDDYVTLYHGDCLVIAKRCSEEGFIMEWTA